MRLPFTVCLSDRSASGQRRMKAYIASRIPEEGCRVVVADGPDGEVWVDLDPVRYGDGGGGQTGTGKVSNTRPRPATSLQPPSRRNPFSLQSFWLGY